jgi:hypothetical protein
MTGVGFSSSHHSPRLLVPRLLRRGPGLARRVGEGVRLRTCLGRAGIALFAGVGGCGSGLGRGLSSYSRRRRTRGSRACGRDMCRYDLEHLHLLRVRVRVQVHFLPRRLYLRLRYGQVPIVRRRIWMAQ